MQITYLDNLNRTRILFLGETGPQKHKGDSASGDRRACALAMDRLREMRLVTS